MSRIILDVPALLEEQLVALAAACKLFPIPCSRPSLERWLRKGSRGVQLESVLVCGKRMTSVEAIDRFVRNQLRTEPGRVSPKRGGKSRREIAEASQKYGLPEPE